MTRKTAFTVVTRKCECGAKLSTALSIKEPSRSVECVCGVVHIFGLGEGQNGKAKNSSN